MSILVLLTLVGLTVINFRTCRDWRYPPFIMSAMWLIAMTMYYLAPIKFNSVGILTFSIFVTTIIAFSGGAQLAFFFHGTNPATLVRRSRRFARPAAHPCLRKIFLAFSAAILPLTIAKAFQIVSQSGIDIFFWGLRQELLTEDTGGYGLIGYAAVLSYFTTFIYAIELRTGIKEKLQYYLSLSISLAYAVLSTGKTTIFFILAVLMGIALMQGRFKLRRLVVSVLVFLLFFGFFAFATLKGANPEAAWSDNVASLEESLLIYSVGALPAFDQVVRKDAPLSYGENTFIGVFNLIRRFAGRSRVSPIQQEVAVPYPINVYTGLHPVYRDFGIVGVILTFLMIGTASTYFFLRGLAGDQLHVFYYALVLFPLLFMTFSDQYFAPMPTWIMYGTAAYLYFRKADERRGPTSDQAVRFPICALPCG
jgi:oligosaccharide repeat unit polymerase